MLRDKNGQPAANQNGDKMTGSFLVHQHINFGPYADSQLEGAAAHEGGHANWFGDCNSCQIGGSAMGSQPTWSVDQALGPTECDIFWYPVYTAR
jgi:hypothetical protein